MPRNSRCVLPGTPYHITQRGNDRQRVFFLNSDRELYLDLLQRNLAYTHTRLLAFCLMADHIHAVVVPDRPDSLALLFRRVHGPYAQYVNTRSHHSGHLWQNRFYSCPLSFSHLTATLNYVEQNPCRAGLVERSRRTIAGRAPRYTSTKWPTCSRCSTLASSNARVESTPGASEPPRRFPPTTSKPSGGAPSTTAPTARMSSPPPWRSSLASMPPHETRNTAGNRAGTEQVRHGW